MDATHVIAQMIGLVYVVAGIGILMNPLRLKQLIADFTTNAGLGYLGGLLALLSGYAIVTFGPNTAELSFEGLVSLIGWIAIVKGIVYLWKPELIAQMAGFFIRNAMLAGGFCLIVGLTLGYYGFM